MKNRRKRTEGKGEEDRVGKIRATGKRNGRGTAEEIIVVLGEEIG